MVINSPCLTDKKELAIPEQTTTGKSKEVGTLRYLSLVVPLTKVGDEAVHKELGDRMERAATTASSFQTEQDNAQTRFEAASKSPMIHLSQELKFLQMLPEKRLSKATPEEGRRFKKILKIIRVRDVTVAYQSFEDMLKGFDREDLVALWSLVKERFRSAEPTEDMEKALWVELKRLFEPDKDDVLWKLQRYMHDPLTWRLYGSCVVNCSYRIDARQKVASRRR
ncbi:hypothetical protein Tco_1470983 [Tanacetum coccineum]